MRDRRKLVAAVESLEIRRLLATITVNSAADTVTPNDGAVTLREAITTINAGNDLGDPNITAQTPGTFGTNDTIKFNLPADSPTIFPKSQLPTITKPVTIDGYSQPGSSAATSTAAATFGVYIDGVDAGNVSGLVVGAPNVTIDGLEVYRFVTDSATTNKFYPDGGHGIFLTTGSSNDTIWGNDIGIFDGTYPVGNETGIYIAHQSSNNTIGGTTPDRRNIISGNKNDGIAMEYYFDGDQSSGNVVEGNYIGTNSAGTDAVANGDGIDISRAYNNTVGGVTPGARNLISGNTRVGVNIAYDANVVEGNYIGVDVTGTLALGNGDDGVYLFHTYDSCTIGGAASGAGNVISGNQGNGVSMSDTGDELVAGNLIGTNAAATAAVPNAKDGVYVDDAEVTVGGTDAGSGNVISGNTGNGVHLTGDGGTVVKGNFIGTNAAGTAAIANGDAGVLLDSGAAGYTVGGTTAAARNIISGNGLFGVQIDGDESTTDSDPQYNVVEGNYIGTDVTGTLSLNDGYAGVFITRGASNNTIGGTDPGAGNVISGVGGVGVYIADQYLFFTEGQSHFTTGNVVEGNFIGTDPTGMKRVFGPYDPKPNYFDGIGVYLDTFTSGNTIGGAVAGARNVISNSSSDGVRLDETSNNTIEGNYIGVDATGEAALSNTHNGILDFAGKGNVIGGNVAGAGNVISGNGLPPNPYAVINGVTYQPTKYTDNGVRLDNTAGDVVAGNSIGTDATGTKAIANYGSGVRIDSSSSSNTVGGNSVAAGNLIADNGAAGVVVTPYDDTAGDQSGARSVKNVIRLNSMFANNGLGIDLDEDGSFTNDYGDADGGANDRQNFPVIANATSTGSSVTVSGTLNSVAGTNFTLDFYAAANADAYGITQGRQYLGSIAVVTDSSGNAKFKGTFSVALGSNQYLTATATNYSAAPYGDTSEFSQAIQATTSGTSSSTNTPPALSIGDVSMNEGNSGTTAYTFTVARTGDLSGASTVIYAAADGTATTADGDYQAVSNTLAFDPGQASKTITVLVNGDTKVESDEMFTVNLSSPTGATISRAQAIGTIVNDDATILPPTLPVISIGDVSMSEGNSGTTAFVFTITRSGDLSGGSSVQYATADGTATSADKDYAPQSNTIGFDPGQATRTVTILVNGDNKVEGDESFSVNLSNPSGATLADASAGGTILNDDANPPPPPPPASGSVLLVSDPRDSTKKALQINGADGKDTITVTKSGSSQGKAVVKINGVSKGTFSFSGSILVYGKGNNDTITIDSAITRSAFVWGGDGNDTISGGGGSDVLVGNAGNDSLNGNAGRDLLFGGDGADKLDGGSDDDLLVAGGTSVDDNLMNLCKLQDEWKRSDKNYATRVSHILNGGGLNSSVKLNAGNIFSSSGAKDSLTGGSGTDLFFAAIPGDLIADKTSGETAVDVG